MATLTTSLFTPLAGFFRALGEMSVTLGNGLCCLAEARSRRDRIERLQALSDAQLRVLGLRRDQVVAHVFRDRLGY